MGHRFAVWAPRASQVEVKIGEKGWPMAPVAPVLPADGGWWAAQVDEAVPGTDYGFSLDGGPTRPDPRSAWQPQGVDGPSRVVDHGAFAWSDRAWRGLHLPSAVLYELHVGTFTPAGTFDAVADRLDHLVALGVDGIELLPVAEFSGRRGWGYDGVDLFAPHHAYGGPDGLKRLVDACHGRGLGMVMDVVYNHLGPAGNYLGEFGPYFTDKHSTNWGEAVNFDDADSGEVRSFVVDNARMWLRDYHCDGLRLDAVHAIKDDSAYPIVEELAQAVHRLAASERRPLFVVAESDLNDPRVIRSADAGGLGVDAVWADEFHHALHAALSEERDGYYDDFGSLRQVAVALRQAWVYTGEYSPYRRRVHGRAAPAMDGERFVVFLQNHDQVGNRATGDRLTHLDRVGLGRAKIGAALLLLSPFVPLLFQGEEWAASTPFLYFTDHQDPGLGEAVSQGRRREFASFGWAPDEVPDPQDPATFARSKLDWDEAGQGEHASMLAWYRHMIELRRRFPALSDRHREQVRTSFDEHARWLVAARGPVTVAVSLGVEPVTLRLPAPDGAAGAAVIGPAAGGAGGGAAGGGAAGGGAAGGDAAGGSATGVGATGGGAAAGGGPAGSGAASTGVELLAASAPEVVVTDDGCVVLPPDSVAVVRVGERFAT